VGFGGGGEAAAPKPPHFSPSPRRAAAAGRGPGGGVSPKGQVVSMPVYVWVNFLKFISQRLNSYLLQTKSAGRSDTSGTFAEEVYRWVITYHKGHKVLTKDTKG